VCKTLPDGAFVRFPEKLILAQPILRIALESASVVGRGFLLIDRREESGIRCPGLKGIAVLRNRLERR
jgi:hypothetical protein